MISRMIGTSLFSDRTEFSVTAGSLGQADAAEQILEPRVRA